MKQGTMLPLNTALAKDDRFVMIFDAVDIC